MLGRRGGSPRISWRTSTGDKELAVCCSRKPRLVSPDVAPQDARGVKRPAAKASKPQVHTWRLLVLNCHDSASFASMLSLCYGTCGNCLDHGLQIAFSSQVGITSPGEGAVGGSLLNSSLQQGWVPCLIMVLPVMCAVKRQSGLIHPPVELALC